MTNAADETTVRRMLKQYLITHVKFLYKHVLLRKICCRTNAFNIALYFLWEIIRKRMTYNQRNILKRNWEGMRIDFTDLNS